MTPSNAKDDAVEAVDPFIAALCKRVWEAAHWEGWRGNQLSRDVQHVDAETGWNLYVSNGALNKSIEAMRAAQPDAD
jgi:hypothetical protein